jgi:hypothetical protein
MPQDYYFAPRATATTGSGTKDSPWAAELFESKMIALGSSAIAHLDAGTYPVRGTTGSAYNATTNPGWQIQNHVYGQRGAVIQLQNPVLTASGSIKTVHNPQDLPLDGIEVEGITIDCNASAFSSQQPTCKIEGLVLYGRNLKVRRVSIINHYGSLTASNEAWAASIYQPAAAYQTGNHTPSSFIDCEARSPLGDYTNGFQIGGILATNPMSGHILGCRAYDHTAGYAFGIGNVRQGLIADCTAVNCQIGYYDDASGGYGLDFLRNQILRIPATSSNGGRGFVIQTGAGVGDWQNVRIADNVFELAPVVVSDRPNGLLLAAPVNNIIGLTVDRNQFRYSDGYGTHSHGAKTSGSDAYACSLSVTSGNIRNWGGSGNTYAPTMALTMGGFSTAGFSQPTY